MVWDAAQVVGPIGRYMCVADLLQSSEQFVYIYTAFLANR